MNPTPSTTVPASESDTKSLDTIRRSLLTLTTSLSSLQQSLSAPQPNNAPLPPWSSLQTSFALLTGNLLALSEHIDNSRDFLTRAHAFPLPSFPGREQEALLSQLLKKKADVDVERWTRQAEDKGRLVAAQEETIELWEWALQAAAEAAERIPWGIDVTIEEREREGGVEEVKARSGLKRELKIRSEGEDEDDEDEDDEDQEAGSGDADDAGSKMDVDGAAGEAAVNGKAPSEKLPIAPMIPIEDVLRFMITGAGGSEPEVVTMSGAAR